MEEKITVNGIEYADSAMISDKTKEADIDDTKSVINLESKALYSDLQEAINEANQNDTMPETEIPPVIRGDIYWNIKSLTGF